MPPNRRTEVQYHPEFLYFNEMVRRRGYTPGLTPSIWKSDEIDSLSDYEVFDYLLRCVVLDANSKPVSFLLDGLRLQGLDLHLDYHLWLERARSIGIEGILERYSKVIFDYFGTSFDLPTLKVSPPRLRAGDKKLFERMASGSYTTNDVMRHDPPCYYPNDHLIFMPVTEASTKLPVGFYEEMVVHELLHVPLRGLGHFAFHGKDGSFIVTRAPDAWAFGPFGELFANVGSLFVLKKGKGFKKEELLTIVCTVMGRRAPASSKVAWDAANAMIKLGFPLLCDLLRPVFTIYKEVAFLEKEHARIMRASQKKLEGILRKQYGYTRSVRGKSREKVRSEVAGRTFSRLNAVSQKVQEMSLQRILAAALVQEKSVSRRRAFSLLADAFSEERKGEWHPLLERMSRFE